MGNMSRLLVFIVCAFSIHTSLEASFCDNVKYITIDDPRRSTAHKTNSSKFWLCDRTIIQDDVWYRFLSAAGEEMPTIKPDPGSCGAGSPLWMNGSHPTVQEGPVTRKVCANVPYQHPFGCADHYDIKVHNCSGYYIYQLKKPKRCYVVYCAGSKLPNCTNADPEDYCLENRPPYISMPHRYYALEDSEFELLFNATDPEGYPMRYSYLSNATVSNVSVDQKLVSISVKKSGSISLKVEDYPYGGHEDIHTIEIVTIPCKCQNKGKCYNEKNVSTNYDDFSNVKCVCVGPYTGKLCQVSPCDNLPCFPEVDCSVRSNSYECGKCPAKFEGDGENCQLVLTGGDVVVEAELKIVSGLKWNDSLLDKTSFLYKSQTAKIVAQIKQVFSGNEQFLAVVVNSYRNESVAVEFQLILKEKTNNPLEPLRTHATQNKFGNFTVDPNSIKEKQNRPPYISMPHRYYALEDSEFELLFNATDPEGYPMRYSYLSNATVSSVSVDQKLVSISVKKSGSVSLKVIDYGGREDIHTIEIVTIPCKCQNKGKCYNNKNVSTSRDDFSNVKCVCVGPYTGKLCQVSPCDNLPCFPEVDCSVRGDSYKCGKCPPKFEGNGKNCQLILSDDDVVVEAELKIVSGLKWNDNLLDKTSILYKRQTTKIMVEIKQAFSGNEQFLAVVVNRYRKGSVVVEFQVVLKEMTNDPLEPLRTYAKQNKFGSFIVDRNSIKEENSTEVEGTLNVVSGLEWNDDLLDKSSSHFQTESYKVAREIRDIYENEKDFVYVFVTGFRKKDLMVEFKIVWRNKANKNKVLEKLRSETKDGQLGNLKIKKDSVKEKKTVNLSNGSSHIAGIDKVVFIVVVCIVSILALVSIVVCGFCIRKKHVSIIMLTTQDDHHQFAPRNESRATNKSEDFQMKKRPAHNQVVDIQYESTGKSTGFCFNVRSSTEHP